MSIVFEDISSGEDNEGTEDENNSTRPSSARLNSIQEEESGGKERGALESSRTTTTTEEEIALAQEALAQAMGALNVQAEEANMKRQPSISIQRGNSVTKGSDASSSSSQRDLSGKIEFARGAGDFGAFKDCVLDLLSEMARRLQDLECRSGQSPPAAAMTPVVAAAGPPPPAPPPPPPPPPMAAPAPLKIHKGPSNQKKQHVKVVISETDGGAGGGGSGGDLMSQLANTLNRRKNRTSLANAYNNLK